MLRSNDLQEEPRDAYQLKNGLKINKSVHVLSGDKMQNFYGLQGIDLKRQASDERNNLATPIKTERRGTINNAAVNTSRLLNSGLAKVDKDQISGCGRLDTDRSLGDLKLTRNQLNLLKKHTAT